MPLKKPTKKKPITKKVAITKSGKTDREVEIEVENREIQDGTSPKSKLGNNVPAGQATIGMSLGATLNMGDFQSARVDVFIQRTVKDDDTSIKDGYNEISDLLHNELQRQSALLDEQ